MNLKLFSTTLVLIAIASFLYSCESEEKNASNSVLVEMQFEAYYSNTQELFFGGQSSFISVTASLHDPSNALRVQKGNLFVGKMSEINSSTEKILLAIHNEKKNLLKVLGCSKALGEFNELNSIPAKINGSDLTTDKVDAFDANSVLKKEIKQYRNDLVQLVASSNVKSANGSYEYDKRFKIQAPKLNELKGEESDTRILKASLKKASPDDSDALLEILLTITPRKGELTSYSAREALHYLCIQEARILKARKIALRLIGSRLSSDGYVFDKIIPLAYGPNLLEKGDEFELQVMIAAFDSQNNPIVTCEQGGTIETIEGVARIRMTADKTTTFRGTIGVHNKSGVIKTSTWEKTVSVQ